MAAKLRQMCFASGLLVTSSMVPLVGRAATTATTADKSTPPAAPQHHKSGQVEDNAVEALQVTGRRAVGNGRMKVQTSPEATYSLTRTAIAQRVASASPLQLAATLPGVNFSDSNPFGLAVRNWLSVRGLDETEMGFVVEGMPGTDQSLNYPFTETWADPENISDITLIAGTTRLEDPNVTASGGEFIETVRTPSDKKGAETDVSVGSHAAFRWFGRADTGYIGNSGVRLFTSFSYTAGDNFEGEGRGHKDHVDFKMSKDWENGMSSLFVSYTNWFDDRLNTYTLSNWEAGNANGGNFQPYNYAENYYPGVSTWSGAYAYDTQRVLLSMPNAFQLTPRLSLHTTPYFHYVFSNGMGLSTLNLNSLYEGDEKVHINPSSVSVYDSKGDFQAVTGQDDVEYAAGINSYLQYDVTPSNNFMVGYWYDHWNLTQLNGYNPVNSLGEANSLFGEYQLKTTNGTYLAGTHYQDSVQTNAIYAADTQKLLNGKLTINAGFKELMFYTSGTEEIPSPLYHFSSAISAPLPRLYISYDLSPHVQIYVNATTNSKPPLATNAYPDDYSVTTGKVTQQGNDALKAEYAIGEEMGVRYHGSAFNTDFAFFNMNLTNHQVDTEEYLNGLLVQQAISVGGETIRGFTGEIALNKMYGFTPYANVQYLHTTIDNNVEVGGDYLRTTGKQMVESPPWMADIGLTYSYGPFFANLDFKWVDSQYSTFTNDQSMPAYKTIDMALGYHLPHLPWLKNSTVRLNMTNLTDVAYLGAIAGPQPNALATKGVYGTTIAGTQPSYYISAPFALMATFSTDF